MHINTAEESVKRQDAETLRRMGYAQELLRAMRGFSNYAISLSIICIVGVFASFHIGFCAVGGAAVGIGWPIVLLFVLAVAATMAQIASAFPTAGGLYHWASILGGRSWGWVTAWFNLLGLVTVLAAINVGTFLLWSKSIGTVFGLDIGAADATTRDVMQIVGVVLITTSQAFFNHLGIRATTVLTDFSGYWILAVAVAITCSLLAFAPGWDPVRLITVSNYSGRSGHDVWPWTENRLWLSALGFLLPAYNLTGFDGSAHTSEETIGASINVPKGIVRSVLVSGLVGWIMLSALVLAIPDMDRAAALGDTVFYRVIEEVLPRPLAAAMFVGIATAVYLCGLATVTSASRMVYAFARDGGLPFAARLRRIHPTLRSPVAAIWTVSLSSILFTVYTPVYSTIISVSTIFLYVSYIVPTALGAVAFRRTWTRMGPFDLGRFFRPLAVFCVLGCSILIVIGTAPRTKSRSGSSVRPW